MAAWVVWLIAAAVLAVGEVLTLALVAGFVAVGAVAAAVAALAGGGILVQLVAFALASVALVLLVRPLATRHLHTAPRIRMGTAALVGEHAVVLERVDRDGGRVRIGAEIWSARAWDDSRSFEPGARVEVMGIEGATALVEE
jgi:membrane protein implicated in regulation of membrane protease activity